MPTAGSASRARRLIAGVTAIAAAVSLAACGSDSKDKAQPTKLLDTANVAKAIEQSILSQRKIHATVTCPTAILQKKGQNFACVAKTRRGSTTFDVVQQNDAGYVTYAAAK